MICFENMPIVNCLLSRIGIFLTTYESLTCKLFRILPQIQWYQNFPKIPKISWMPMKNLQTPRPGMHSMQEVWSEFCNISLCRVVDKFGFLHFALNVPERTNTLNRILSQVVDTGVEEENCAPEMEKCYDSKKINQKTLWNFKFSAIIKQASFFRANFKLPRRLNQL